MNGVLTLLFLVLCLGIIFFVPPMAPPLAGGVGVVTVYYTAKAVLLCVFVASIAGVIIYTKGADEPFLIRLFVAALMVRMLIGTAIFVFQAQEFFGGDALTYDFFGNAQLQGWLGDKYMASVANGFTGSGQGSGWGMVYLVAVIYGLIGRNMLAVQLVNSVLGAATSVIIFLCAHKVFNNIRVARFAAIAVAFYPSLVLWSSQGLKDGPIVFFLALTILATLRLGQELSAKYIVALIISLLALLSLRFYVFYMICAAIAGAFVIGLQQVTAKSFTRQFAAMLLLGLALTYFGVTRSANIQFERYGSFEQIQRSRLDAATSAESGFGQDVDVSSSEGALSTIPMGLAYLLFAPFPWQVVSLRQSITLPEMVVWWTSVPLLVLGLWFSIKYRLRMISPILSFTAMLSLAYSVVQGNVGTAYRQRAQLLVFYFIFVSVGLVLLLEKREEKKRRELLQRRELATQQATTLRIRSAARLSEQQQHE